MMPSTVMRFLTSASKMQFSRSRHSSDNCIQHARGGAKVTSGSGEGEGKVGEGGGSRKSQEEGEGVVSGKMGSSEPLNVKQLMH